MFPRLAGIATRGTSLARCQTDTIQSLSSGMQAQWYRHEVLANNLANVSTTGFKQDSLTLKQGRRPRTIRWWAESSGNRT